MEKTVLISMAEYNELMQYKEMYRKKYKRCFISGDHAIFIEGLEDDEMMDKIEAAEIEHQRIQDNLKRQLNYLRSRNLWDRLMNYDID